MIRYFHRALAATAFLLATSPLYAHTIVGNRVFPATLTIDDPGVNDELALPTFSYLQSANPNGFARSGFLFARMGICQNDHA